MNIIGLTCINLNWNETSEKGYRGIKFQLCYYTGEDNAEDYNWGQKNSQNDGPWLVDNSFRDDNGFHNTGTMFYYSNEELLSSINGNTISFYDHPRFNGINITERFELTLYKGYTPIFSISYGYRIEDYNIKIYYPKLIRIRH